MNLKQMKALAVLAILCSSIYFADDFVRALGIRALPVGALLVIGICYAIVKPETQK